MYYGGNFIYLHRTGKYSSFPGFKWYMSVSSLCCSAFLLMIPIIIVYNTVLGLLGVIMYTYYNMLKCGPLEAGFVSTMNQVTTTFVNISVCGFCSFYLKLQTY